MLTKPILITSGGQHAATQGLSEQFNSPVTWLGFDHTTINELAQHANPQAVLSTNVRAQFFYRCNLNFDIYKVHTSTNALFIKLDKDLKFTLKITLTCSYVFRSTTVW